MGGTRTQGKTQVRETWMQFKRLEKHPQVYVSVSLDYIQHYFDMDNELQALLALLSLSAAVLKLNSAFHHVTTAYMVRMQATI